MTALGFLHPGHCAEDDYPRIEQLLAGGIRVDLVRADPAGEEGAHPDASLRLGAPHRLAAGVEQLRLSGAEAIVWASTSGSFTYGREGAHEQLRTLATAAGMPASSTSFAFVHAARELRAARVAVAATYPAPTAALFAEFLGAGGLEVTSVHAAGVTAERAGTWGEAEVLALARAADASGAEAVLLPDTALHTVACLPALERELGKPVLTANQVTVWEGLRLTDRRVNAPGLGALFRREPIVQV
ncbi:decarboxylase [Streptomyces sp. NPDC005811]|uniref:maleate cis-trans isomerase family protein n=1 Tax=Streptomyces sp. NPDC005811 TaxID=3154565 RepID=UPI0033FDA39C